MNVGQGIIIVEQEKITAQIDKGIVDLYYNLIPLSFVARKPLYYGKITVVRSPPIEKFFFDLAKNSTKQR